VSGSLARARLEREQIRLEEQLRQAQKMEALGHMAGGVAHDFNNLLTIIRISTQLLERQLHPQDPLLEHVQNIQNAGDRATDLTRRLLSFSRREIIEPRTVNLNPLIANLTPMLERLVGENIELKTITADGLWPVKVDPSQMDQVLVNLVVNARAAMPEGGSLTIETANTVLDGAYVASYMDARLGDHVELAIYTDNVIARHSVLESGTDFIPKPLTAKSLTHKVRSILDRQTTGNLHPT
jgi:signal transduction histidine kinase